MRKNFSKAVRGVFFYGIIAFLFIIWVGPLLWVIISSFQPTQVVSTTRLILFFKPILTNYSSVFHRYPFHRFILNSFTVTAGTTVLAITAGTMVAYSIVRFKTYVNSILCYMILFGRFLVPAVLIIPFFLMFRKLQLLDTLYALILVNLVFNLPLIVWILISFIQGLPLVELEEAAMIDGATKWVILQKIVFPLLKPGLVAASILCAIFSWNEFLYALILTVSEKSRTLPLATNCFIGGHFIEWGPIFAAQAIISIPLIIFATTVSKYLVKGLTLGAIK